MGFFKRRKAKKLAKQQEQMKLQQEQMNEVKVEQKVVAEPEKVVQPTPVVEKVVKPAPEVMKAPEVEKKVEKVEVVPNEENGKKEIKTAKYHVSQNKDPKSDNHRKWRVRKEGSEKTIKFFETQKEAIEYADGLALAAGSSVVIHKLDGSIRKQDYAKKA
ncbi:MAG: DUF2188 domain-containing protein [Firmicutes bacterium]|nr:DUF2188 domain-containing protein [Bacillota bacterium]